MMVMDFYSNYFMHYKVVMDPYSNLFALYMMVMDPYTHLLMHYKLVMDSYIKLLSAALPHSTILTRLIGHLCLVCKFKQR